jgi:hypothetical protein
MDFFAEHLRPAGGTLGFRGTVVGNHWSNGKRLRLLTLVLFHSVDLKQSKCLKQSVCNK